MSGQFCPLPFKCLQNFPEVPNDSIIGHIKSIALWVALLFLIVQLLENALLVPRIQGGYLRIHPAVVIVLLVLGAYIAGFWGLVLAVPLAATIVEIYKYMRHGVKAEENQ